jgi:hypothetical protein
MTCAGCSPCPLQVAPRGELHYEIHITVEEADVDRFNDLCAEMKIKPLLIHLQLASGGVQGHLMTSETMKNSNDRDAAAAAGATIQYLSRAGLKVARTKIETVPWHPRASSPGPDQYHESHLAVTVSPGLGHHGRLEDLRWLLSGTSAHLSNSAFKENVHMVTIRDRHPVDGTASVVRDVIRRAGFSVGPVTSEFCLYDSNVAMDKEWVG